MIRICLVVLYSLGSAWGSVISLTGNFVTSSDVFTTTFTLTSVSEVNIQTWSYGGGTNAMGVAIAPGGFDPAVTLFLGTGPAATLLDANDDGTCPPGNFDPVTTGCLDSTLAEIGLLPGMYTIALTVSPNLANGPTLGDGFTGGGNFVDVFGSTRTSSFALDIVITPAVAVPEPRSTDVLALLFLGAILLYFKRPVRSSC